MMNCLVTSSREGDVACSGSGNHYSILPARRAYVKLRTNPRTIARMEVGVGGGTRKHY